MYQIEQTRTIVICLANEESEIILLEFKFCVKCGYNVARNILESGNLASYRVNIILLKNEGASHEQQDEQLLFDRW